MTVPCFQPHMSASFFFSPSDGSQETCSSNSTSSEFGLIAKYLLQLKRAKQENESTNYKELQLRVRLSRDRAGLTTK